MLPRRSEKICDFYPTKLQKMLLKSHDGIIKTEFGSITEIEREQKPEVNPWF
jgi:hypothetical protein